MLLYAFFTLPIDWLDQVKSSAGELVGDYMPIVLFIVAISVAILVIRLLAGLAR